MQKVSGILYQAAAPYWEKCLNHPFVVGIGDGTLDEEKFPLLYAAGLPLSV